MEKKQNKKTAAVNSTVNNEINLSIMFGLVFLSTFQEFDIVQSIVKHDHVSIRNVIKNMRQKTIEKKEKLYEQIKIMELCLVNSMVPVEYLEKQIAKNDFEEKINLFMANSIAMGFKDVTREKAIVALKVIQGNGSVTLDNRKQGKTRVKINHELTNLESLFLDLYRKYKRKTSGEIDILEPELTNHEKSRYGTISGYIASLLGEQQSNSFIDQLISEHGLNNVDEQMIREKAPRSLVSLGVNAYHVYQELRK